MDINTDPDYDRTMDPDIVLINNQGLDVTLAPGGSSGYSDQHGSSNGMAYQHAKWSKMLVQTSNIGMPFDCILTDADYSGTTDKDMVPSYSLGLDITLVPCDNTEHSDLYGVSCSMTITTPLGLR